MSRNLFVALAAAVILFFTTSPALADIGDLAYDKVQALVATGHNSGNTSGTILNPEGRGDLLIFPYYDVREINGKSQDFHILVINNESDACEGLSQSTQCYEGIAAKLRFREWDKGEEVFEIDIWLHRADVWYGVVTHNRNIALPYGARITSSDYVITDYTGTAFTLGTPLSGGLDFPVTAYIPGPVSPPFPSPVAPNSPGSTNLMGYIEVIGEERTYDHYAPGVSPLKVTRTTNEMLNGAVVGRDAPNSLTGMAYIVRVADGSSFAYNATAIANFSRNKGSLFSGLDSPSPTLMDGEDTLDQLELQIGKKEVSAGYSIENAIAGKFSLILTFPTKHYHFCGKPDYTIKGDPTAPCAADYPVGSPFKVERVGNNNCYPDGLGDPIDLTVFDRSAHELGRGCMFVGGCVCPPPTQGIFWTVNVIGLYRGTPPAVPQLAGWTVRDNLAFQTAEGVQVFDSGYIRIKFPHTGQVQSLNPKITEFLHFDMPFNGYEGLPVVGVALQEFQNNNVGGFYGDTREIFYRTKWKTQ